MASQPKWPATIQIEKNGSTCFQKLNRTHFSLENFDQILSKVPIFILCRTLKILLARAYPEEKLRSAVKNEENAANFTRSYDARNKLVLLKLLYFIYNFFSYI